MNEWPTDERVKEVLNHALLSILPESITLGEFDKIRFGMIQTIEHFKQCKAAEASKPRELRY